MNDQVKEIVEVEEEETRFYAAGWYEDLDNEKYHRSNGTSSSGLKTLLPQTAAHLKYSREHPKSSTPNMRLGTAVHSLVLEPHKFEEDNAVMPVINARTNAGKAEKADFVQANEGKNVITLDQYDVAQKMAERVHAHPIAGLLVKDLIVESSIYWWYKARDREDGTEYKELLKVRPDGISKNYPILIDLKTTADGSYSGFIKSVQNFYYHVSAAMYLEGVNQNKQLMSEVKHVNFNKFVFVCVENFPPYEVSCYELSEDYRKIGYYLYAMGVERLQLGRENAWPGYPEEVRVLEPPGYARNFHIV